MAKKKTEPPKGRSKQKYPKEYILSMADRLFTTHPTLEIYQNTLKDLWFKAVEEGMVRSIENSAYFRRKRDERRTRSYDMAITNIGDLIHGGVTKHVAK
jgi:hypothetical protein